MTRFFLWASFLSSFLFSLVAASLVDSFLIHRIAIIGDFAGLERSLNRGIAFGIELPSGFQEVVIGAALLFMGLFAWRAARSRLSQIAFGLVLGGGIANIVDRFRDGFVTDFFQVGAFPVFNLADSCITVGVFLLLFEVVFSRRGESTKF